MRMGHVARLRPECVETYDQLHRDVADELMVAMRESGLHNYSIFRHDTFLFSFCEYDGSDYEADADHMAAGEMAQRWVELTTPLFDPNFGNGEEWVELREIFRLD